MRATNRRQRKADGNVAQRTVASSSRLGFLVFRMLAYMAHQAQNDFRLRLHELRTLSLRLYSNSPAITAGKSAINFFSAHLIEIRQSALLQYSDNYQTHVLSMWRLLGLRSPLRLLVMRRVASSQKQFSFFSRNLASSSKLMQSHKRRIPACGNTLCNICTLTIRFVLVWKNLVAWFWKHH